MEGIDSSKFLSARNEWQRHRNDYQDYSTNMEQEKEEKMRELIQAKKKKVHKLRSSSH